MTLDTWPVHSDDIHHWHRGPNRASAAILSPRVLGLEVVGAVRAEALEVIEPCLSRFLLNCPGAAHLFWDAERLESHDGAFRDVVLGLLRSHRAQWTAHVLFSSVLVGVTVSAASLASRGAVKGYRQRLEFQTAIEEVLART